MSSDTSAPMQFGRVLTAMVTPFGEDGTLDLDAARKVARHLVDTGHDGILLSGTTGESPTTHVPEKTALIEAVLDEVGGRARIIAGACSNDTAHAVRIAEASRDAGAHGILIVSPYYNKPSQEGLFQHVMKVTESTELPVMLYDIPGRTGVAFGDETLDRLAKCQQIIAVKDATGDVVQGMQRSERTGLAYYSGDDNLNLAWLAHGAAGVVSVVGHIAGTRWAAMAAAVEASDFVGAREIFSATLPAVNAIMGAGIGAVMIKAALQLTGVLEHRNLRLPMVAADENQMNQLREKLLAAGLLPS